MFAYNNASDVLLLGSVMKDRAEYYKNYYERNKDKIAAYHKEYYQDNKDRIKERINSPENAERIKEYSKKYREKNKEKISDYYRRYIAKMKEDPNVWVEFCKRRRVSSKRREKN